eukprot:15333066-Heterocapsa_arctica.AAC.1
MKLSMGTCNRVRIRSPLTVFAKATKLMMRERAQEQRSAQKAHNRTQQGTRHKICNLGLSVS